MLRDALGEQNAQTIRILRHQHANRLIRLRQAARQGDTNAAKRFTLLKLEGCIYPNPDRCASCLKCAEQARATHAELDATQDNDDPEELQRQRFRAWKHSIHFQYLADTAPY